VRTAALLANGTQPTKLGFFAVLIPTLIAVGWCGLGLRRLRGTTLTAPCLWTLFSLLSVLTVESVFAAGLEGPRAAAIRYLAATTTLCPVIGLLGAKRPQDRGWQFIVLTLWIVLILPATQNLAFAPGSPLELHPAWQAFLALLVLTGLGNHLPTRFGVSALLASAGQSILLWGHVPGISSTAGRQAVVVAAMSLALATTLIGLGWPARRTPRHAWDRIWLDFRDMFGVVWGLRVAERINDTARRSHEDLRLHWDGFRCAGPSVASEETAPTESAMHTGLQNQLRRFVSPAWINARLQSPT
jgi:hypothetical protein